MTHREKAENFVQKLIDEGFIPGECGEPETIEPLIVLVVAELVQAWHEGYNEYARKVSK